MRRLLNHIAKRIDEGNALKKELLLVGKMIYFPQYVHITYVHV